MTVPAGLTRVQRRVIDFIRAYKLEYGYAPAFSEIAASTGLAPASKSAVHRHIKALAARGALRYLEGRSRSIELIPASPVLSIELPPQLFANVQDLARKAKVTPEAVVIEAVRDGFAAFRSKTVPRETSEAAPLVA